KLYVFGLRADYMDRFREFLDAEGIPAQTVELTIPIVKRPWPPRLRVLPSVGFDFKKQGEKPTLGAWPAARPPRVVLDWYPRVASLIGKGEATENGQATKNEGKLTPGHLAFIDIDEIYFELQRFKSEKGWHNLTLQQEKVVALLNDPGWYTLFIPPEILSFHDFSQVRIWQQIATVLLKKYCERFYAYKRSAAEAPHLKYVELHADDENFIQDDQYIVRLDEENVAFQRQLEDLRATITRLREAIRSGDFSGVSLGIFAADFKPLFAREHLYQPLIYAKGIEVTPVALNEGELQFVQDLCNFYDAEKTSLFAE